MGEKSKFLIVTADNIVFTGRLSFKFMYDAGIDNADRKKKIGSNWGHIFVGYVDTDVNIQVYDDQSQLVFGWGNPSVNRKWLKEVIVDNDLQSCTLLMCKRHAEIFKAVCDEHGIEYYEFHYHGTLNTA